MSLTSRSGRGGGVSVRRSSIRRISIRRTLVRTEDMSENNYEDKGKVDHDQLPLVTKTKMRI